MARKIFFRSIDILYIYIRGYIYLRGFESYDDYVVIEMNLLKVGLEDLYFYWHRYFEWQEKY